MNDIVRTYTIYKLLRFNDEWWRSWWYHDEARHRWPWYPQTLKFGLNVLPSTSTLALIQRNLIYHSFSTNLRYDSTRSRATIKCLEEVKHQQLEREPERNESKCKAGDTKFEEFVAYNDMCNFIGGQVQNEVGRWHLCQVPMCICSWKVSIISPSVFVNIGDTQAHIKNQQNMSILLV